MATINVLTKDIYNRISAGEVVERPSSVVKELFENSVDAGADKINVEIENGGLAKITVSDNGSGILSADVQKAFLPHATSKLSKASDLDSIKTLGFRGEALASISAVSKVEMTTKTDSDELATNIILEGGEVISSKPTSLERGTTISVSDLFFNTPARLKFLKKPKSEEAEITTLMEQMILSNPNVSVKYTVNGKVIFETYGDGKRNALLSVYGKEALDNTQEISADKNGVLIQGFLGKTSYSKSTRSYQTLIVNGRAVCENTVTMALFNAYSVYMMKRRYPFYVLYLTVPNEIVDVNVHPRKAEIRFQDNRVIYGLVYSTVSQVLDGMSQAVDIIRQPISSGSFENHNESNNDKKEQIIENNQSYAINGNVDETLKTENNKSESLKLNKDLFNEYIERSKRIETLKKSDTLSNEKSSNIDEKKKFEYDKTPLNNSAFTSSVKDWAVEQKPNLSDKVVVEKIIEQNSIFEENKAFIEQYESKKAVQESMNLTREFKYIGQILKCYLIFESQNEVFFIDQHAAHERLLYDRLMEKVKNKKTLQQPLLFPYSFKANSAEYDLLFNIMYEVREIGIELELYGDDGFRITAVPAELTDINIELFLADLISDMDFRKETIPVIIKEKLAQKACKAAIKAGYELSRSEIDALMSMLKGDMGLKCPHGRPIAVKISKNEIDKWFKRIV